jgi:hypothetical protein
MDIKPHSDEEIVNVATQILAKKSFRGSNKTMVLVVLSHDGDGVSYGYEVHFKKEKQTGGNFEWKLNFIRNATSPQ